MNNCPSRLHCSSLWLSRFLESNHIVALHLRISAQYSRLRTSSATAGYLLLSSSNILSTFNTIHLSSHSHSHSHWYWSNRPALSTIPSGGPFSLPPPAFYPGPGRGNLVSPGFACTSVLQCSVQSHKRVSYIQSFQSPNPFELEPPFHCGQCLFSSPKIHRTWPRCDQSIIRYHPNNSPIVFATLKKTHPEKEAGKEKQSKAKQI